MGIAYTCTCITHVEDTPMLGSSGRRYLLVEVSHFLEVWVDPAVIQHREWGL